MNRLIIVRHAERPDISPTAVGNDVLLTEKGKAESRLFGEKVEQPVLSIKTSPIGRCRQTAEIIADATQFSVSKIENSILLGDPGFMIDNAELAWMHWVDKGHESVNQHLISGSQKWSGFVDLESAVNTVKKEIQTVLMDNTKGTHVWVTHDTVLATLASRLLPQNITLEQWPEFLGYLDITLSKDLNLLLNYQAS
ncbi:MAG: broad specificity phosphatase PhoE [Pseudohongiellaceae bacterium]|jgi:broad specificity phosphatase PhoE